jgi:hypothetical protein
MHPKLEELMKQNSFTENTIMYRYTLPEFLTQTENDLYRLNANPNATEIVEDLYKSGHSIPGSEIGQGLAFFVNKEPEYDLPEKKCVKVRLGDIIKQGGLLYPDFSTFSEGCFYMTMPGGFVDVELDS